MMKSFGVIEEELVGKKEFPLRKVKIRTLANEGKKPWIPDFSFCHPCAREDPVSLSS